MSTRPVKDDFPPPPEVELAMRPPLEIVIGADRPLARYVPANGLTVGAASAAGDPTSNAAAAPSAASAIDPASIHRVIERVIVHLVAASDRRPRAAAGTSG